MHINAHDYALQLWGAAAITVVVLVLVELARWFVSRGTNQRAGSLLIGADGRVSTSKFSAALWTVVLVFMLVGIALIFGGQPSKFVSVVHEISPLYFVELGGPFAAAILAKGIVGKAADEGTLNRRLIKTRANVGLEVQHEGSTDQAKTGPRSDARERDGGRKDGEGEE